MSEGNVTFRIKRTPQHGADSTYETYKIPNIKGRTVLDGLWYIVDNMDGGLSFRYSCRGGVCGSCAMKINGIIHLACHTQISTLLPGVITIEPLPYFSIIRDLVVNMEPFMEKFRSMKPFFDKINDIEKENIQTPEDRKRIEKTVTCILCAACHSACPLTAMDDDYLGPAALTAANRFAFDSRNENCQERLTKINNLGDFGGCMKISRCSKVCPRDIEPSERIDEIKKCVSSKSTYPKSEKIKTICGYCSTGCGLTIEKRGDNDIHLITNNDYPVNLGMACPKGWESLAPLKSDDRAVTPLVKNESGNFDTVNWDDAINKFTKTFKTIQSKHGENSLAFISTGQMPIEEMAYLGCLTKFGMGIIHGDGNTRQCMATAAVAYKQSFGFDAPPYTYKDFEDSDVLIFVGANPFIAHPIMWERLCLNKNNPIKIIIDPRDTETAHQADIHHRIKPKTDAALFYCLANILIKCDAIDKDFIAKSVANFDEYKKFVKGFDLKKTAIETGISEKEITALAKIIEDGKNVSFWWTMGVNQSFMGVRTAQSMINLSLITGNIGRPGTGPNSITGQCNAMGSRLYSNTTSLLAGGDFTKPEDRKKIADIFNISEDIIPKTNGWSYDKIVEGIESGTVKGLWIIATNPVHSWINSSHFAKLLDKLEYLVVQDMYLTTETARRADLVLPAAGWGEKQGTFINSERRISVVNKIYDSPGESRSDFEIFKAVAKSWGCDNIFSTWKTPEDTFNTLKEISKGTPCDMTGIKDYAMLEEHGGIQWPYKTDDGNIEKERRLFEDGKFFTPDKKAKLLFEPPLPSPEPPNKEFPFNLITGRGTVAQWHTQTKTSKSEKLKKIYPEKIYAQIHPNDAKRLNINNGDNVVVSSRRGDLTAKSVVTFDVPENQAFISMHYSDTNKLTFPAFDPYSKQPSYKTCAVTIRKKKDAA